MTPLNNRMWGGFIWLSIDSRGGLLIMLFSGSTWCVQVRRSPKEAFAAAMQSWRERCEKMCMSTG